MGTKLLVTPTEASKTNMIFTKGGSGGNTWDNQHRKIVVTVAVKNDVPSWYSLFDAYVGSGVKTFLVIGITHTHKAYLQDMNEE